MIDWKSATSDEIMRGCILRVFVFIGLLTVFTLVYKFFIQPQPTNKLHFNPIVTLSPQPEHKEYQKWEKIVDDKDVDVKVYKFTDNNKTCYAIFGIGLQQNLQFVCVSDIVINPTPLNNKK